MAKKRLKSGAMLTRCKNAIVYRGQAGKAVVVINKTAYRGAGSWDGGGKSVAVCRHGSHWAVKTANGLTKLHAAKR